MASALSQAASTQDFQYRADPISPSSHRSPPTHAVSIATGLRASLANTMSSPSMRSDHDDDQERAGSVSFNIARRSTSSSNEHSDVANAQVGGGTASRKSASKKRASKAPVKPKEVDQVPNITPAQLAKEVREYLETREDEDVTNDDVDYVQFRTDLMHRYQRDVVYHKWLRRNVPMTHIRRLLVNMCDAENARLLANHKTTIPFRVSRSAVAAARYMYATIACTLHSYVEENAIARMRLKTSAKPKDGAEPKDGAKPAPHAITVSYRDVFEAQQRIGLFQHAAWQGQNAEEAALKMIQESRERGTKRVRAEKASNEEDGEDKPRSAKKPRSADKSATKQKKQKKARKA